MDIGGIDLFIVVAYLIALPIFGVYFKKYVHTEEDYFLNVMQVMDNDHEERHSVDLIAGDKVVGAHIGNSVVIFSKDAEMMNTTVSFEIKGHATYNILLTDMAEGTWQVVKDGRVIIPAMQVRPQEGTVYLRGSGGKYQLFR